MLHVRSIISAIDRRQLDTIDLLEALPNFRLNSCLMFSMATMSWHNFTPTKGNQESRDIESHLE